MNCIFTREGDTLTCKCCGSRIKTDKDKVKAVCQGGENCVKPEYPSFYQMAKNAVGAAVEFAKDGFKLADKEEQERRMSICRGCDQYDDSQNRCFSCGCQLSFKTAIGSGDCPLGKWD